jgi:hypothetical protein
MITAVDTAVLLDVVTAGSEFGRRSLDALRSAAQAGRIVACEVVWTEFSAAYPSASAASDALHEFGIDYDPIGAEAALNAGTAWRRYQGAGGPRTRVIADFLIAGHALAQADRLLTRDRGFYRAYFGDLALIDPSRP